MKGMLLLLLACSSLVLASDLEHLDVSKSLERNVISDNLRTGLLDLSPLFAVDEAVKEHRAAHPNAKGEAELKRVSSRVRLPRSHYASLTTEHLEDVPSESSADRLEKSVGKYPLDMRVDEIALEVAPKSAEERMKERKKRQNARAEALMSGKATLRKSKKKEMAEMAGSGLGKYVLGRMQKDEELEDGLREEEKALASNEHEEHKDEAAELEEQARSIKHQKGYYRYRTVSRKEEDQEEKSFHDHYLSFLEYDDPAHQAKEMCLEKCEDDARTFGAAVACARRHCGVGAAVAHAPGPVWTVCHLKCAKKAQTPADAMLCVHNEC